MLIRVLFLVVIDAICAVLLNASKCSDGGIDGWIATVTGSSKSAADEANVRKRIKQVVSQRETFQTADGYNFTFCSGLEKSKELLFNKTKDLSAIGGAKLYVLTLDGVCPKKCNKCNNNNTNCQVLIHIACDPTLKDDEPKFESTSNEDLCSYSFSLVTKTMCNDYPPPSSASDRGSNPAGSKSHISGVGVFFILLFVGVAVYLVAGFLYKRYVLGAQGYEQIPNYLFWRRLVRCAQATVGGNAYGRSSANDPSYRNYDDGNDEFRYDQPPLMTGSVQEPPSNERRRPSNNPPPSKDESDVRLLVV